MKNTQKTVEVKGKAFRDLVEWETVEATDVQICEGFGGKWALVWTAGGKKYLADYNEIKAIVDNAKVVVEDGDGLIKVKHVVIADQPAPAKEIKVKNLTCKQLRDYLLSEWQRFQGMTKDEVKRYIRYNFFCSEYAVRKLSKEFAGR